MIKSFTDIEVYQRSQQLYPKLVALTDTFPASRRKLADQMCRAANSIHANIAEGFGRSLAEFKYFLTRSLGSCNELLTHLVDARAIKLVSRERFDEFHGEYTIVGKQLFRLREIWH